MGVAQRLERLRRILAERQLDGILITQPAVGEAEVVVSFATDGVGVPMGEPLDRGAKVVAGLFEVAAVQSALAKSRMTTRVGRVAGERLLPVRLGITSGVTVLPRKPVP